MMSYPNGVAYITISNNQISNYQPIFKNHMIYKQCTQCIVQCTVQSAMYNVQCTAESAMYTVQCTAQSAMYTVQCTVQSAMYNGQCTVQTTYVLTLKNVEDDCVDFSFSFVPGRQT